MHSVTVAGGPVHRIRLSEALVGRGAVAEAGEAAAGEALEPGPGGASGGSSANGGAGGVAGAGGAVEGGSSGCSLQLWVDADGDGFGTENEPSIWECSIVPGFAPEPGDCNDQDPAVNPGALDTVGDGVDLDCDGFDGKSACEVEDEALRPCGCDAVLASDAATGVGAGCEGFIDAVIVAAEQCDSCSEHSLVVAIRNRGGLTIPKNFTLVVEYSDGTFDFFPLRSEIPPGGAFPIVEFSPRVSGAAILRRSPTTWAPTATTRTRSSSWICCLRRSARKRADSPAGASFIRSASWSRARSG